MAELHDGPHATPPPADEGPVYLGIKNLTEDGHLDLTSVRHISESDFAKWTRRVCPQPGDLVFTYEATLHRYAIIPPGFRGSLGRRVALIRVDAGRVDTRFLLYYFLSPQWRAAVMSRINVGSTVDRIPLIEFPRFPVHLPDLVTQAKVAAVLGAYDELIENNLRRIEIMEETAQAIYREWFVNFRYPGHEADDLVDSPLGPIPGGWELVTFDTLAYEAKVGVSPQDVGADTPYVGLEHIPRRSFTLTDHGMAASVASRKWRFEAGDLLFGKLRPYFHKVARASLDGVCSTDAIVMRPRDGHAELGLLVAFSPEFVGHAVGASGGTDRPRASWSDLARYLIAAPPSPIESEFSTVVRPMIDLAANLASQNANLRATRDLLLPKLVSGEIDVSNLDIDTSWLVA
jgi:type I restriction enzyme S subunit